MNRPVWDTFFKSIKTIAKTRLFDSAVMQLYRLPQWRVNKSITRDQNALSDPKYVKAKIWMLFDSGVQDNFYETYKTDLSEKGRSPDPLPPPGSSPYGY